jgi:hypothetical protein
MSRNECEFLEVQAPARDAVRVPLSSMPKRVVNFAIEKELQIGEAATTTALRPVKTTLTIPPRPRSPLSRTTHSQTHRYHGPRHGLPITQCSHCDRQWKWYHQSWICRRGCAEMLFSVICRTAEACADNGRRIGGRCIHRTTSTTI